MTSHLVGLCQLMKDTCVNSSSHQIVSCGDGVNVPGKMEVKLEINKVHLMSVI